jgi:hypothetical protein
MSVGAVSCCASVDLGEHPQLRGAGLFANSFRVCDEAERQFLIQNFVGGGARVTDSSEGYISEEVSPDHDGCFRTIDEVYGLDPAQRSDRYYALAGESVKGAPVNQPNH